MRTIVTFLFIRAVLDTGTRSIASLSKIGWGADLVAARQ
jgi:hypothetical protein